MAATTMWSRAYANTLCTTLTRAFADGPMYNVSPDVEEVIVCGDLRRNVHAEQVTHICLVGIIKDSSITADVRARVNANVQAIYPGTQVRTYKLYSYVALPDGSGNVSWVVIPRENAGAALLHATGPVIFVKMLEMFAESVGMKFGASGLYLGDAKLLTPTEQAVFERLRARYIAPPARDEARYLEPFSG